MRPESSTASPRGSQFHSISQTQCCLKHANCLTGCLFLSKGAARRRDSRKVLPPQKTEIHHVSMASGYPKQTVVRRGSSAFCCQAKVPKSNASEWSRRSARSVFAGIFRHRCSSHRIETCSLGNSPSITGTHVVAPTAWVPDQQSCKSLPFSPENGLRGPMVSELT
ncbi:MAG: hypothetical protein A4E62_03024 [Syntrophorhabdus sp. PtaU1.Bin002]|nr:MAG: hypothetical protein A4E58_00722 [Syntrophorhabdus sp. PtaB.Bin006]OPY62240.1 MAG: hypothetical protein A4E62_03024 [Syntrophorhabdus sp. PtaU1.Bin002]